MSLSLPHHVSPAELPSGLRYVRLSELTLTREALGTGSSGVVTRGSLDGAPCAVKRVRVYAPGQRALVISEAAALAANDCEAIVTLLGVCVEEEGACLLLLELMDGALDRCLRGGRLLPEGVLAGVAFQMVWGAAYLAHEGLLHRDIKPGNVLISRNGAVKLADFGCARAAAGAASTVIGTCAYMSPERTEHQLYSAAADVWGVGLTLLEAGSGEYPFSRALGGEASQLAVAMAVSECELSWPPPGAISPQLRALLESTLRREPRERPTAAALLDHAWFAEQGVDSLAAARARVAGWAEAVL